MDATEAEGNSILAKLKGLEHARLVHLGEACAYHRISLSGWEEASLSVVGPATLALVYERFDRVRMSVQAIGSCQEDLLRTFEVRRPRLYLGGVRQPLTLWRYRVSWKKRQKLYETSTVT